MVSFETCSQKYEKNEDALFCCLQDCTTYKCQQQCIDIFNDRVGPVESFTFSKKSPEMWLFLLITLFHTLLHFDILRVQTKNKFIVIVFVHVMIFLVVRNIFYS